jgi:MFS family permease
MHPKPGIIPLRPLALGEIFDGGFQAIRSNPRTMMGLSAVVLAIVIALSAVPEAALMRELGSALAQAPRSFEDFLNSVNAQIEVGAVGMLMTVIAVQIVTAMLVLAVSTAVLGHRVSPGQAWKRVRPRILAVLGLSLVQTLAMVGALLLPAVPGVLLAVAGASVPGIILAMAGGIGGVVLVVFLATRWAFTAPTLLLEEQGVFAAMKRSFRLVKGDFWRVLGITLLAQLLVGIGGALIQMPFSLVSLAFQDSDRMYQDFWPNLGQLFVQGIGQVAAGAVFYPFAAAVTTLLYIDVRMRREGLDVELLQAAETGPGA